MLAKRRRRKDNYTVKELDMIVDLFIQNKHILSDALLSKNNKFTYRAKSHNRHVCWILIEKEVCY